MSNTTGLSLDIKVSALWQGRVLQDAQAMQPTHVISIVNPGTAVPDFSADGRTAHLRAYIPDFCEPDHDYAGTEDLESIRCFVDEVVASSRQPKRLLIHCHLGASRSTATALYAFARMLGPGQESEALDRLLSITNKPWPNRGFIAYFDAASGHGGRLLKALDSYRDKHPRRLDAYARINRMLGRE